ncbi:phage tail tube protein [Sulfitobacter sp.]|uniref:phage tail tube protein n=1 Tax=Sulfitobacter sp. TaxID=1903071 RepID=UPI003F6C71E4
MAVANAIIGYGTTFAFGDGADPEVFTVLAEVTDITAPSDSVDIIEATHMSSPDRTKEFVAGLNDPGECSFDIHFIPGAGDDTVIQALRNAGTKNNYQITWPNGRTWTFAAILTGYAPTAPVNDRMTATVTFKVTSSYVDAAGV